MISAGFRRRITAVFLSILTVLCYSGVAEAIVITTNTTWYDPAPLNDSLTINPGVTLRIGTAGGINGGNLIINLPNGGSLIISNGGGIDLSAMAMGGNGGNLTVNLSGATGTVNVAGLINANGLGTGAGGNVILNGTSFNLASSGRILALGGTAGGSGGTITLNNASGAINVLNGFVMNTNGVSSGSDNIITIDGIGVNVNGIVDASGFGGADGGQIVIDGNTGVVTIASTADVKANGGVSGGDGGTISFINNGAGDITIQSTVLAAGTQGQNGGTISITASGVGGDVLVNSGGRLIAASAAGGGNAGNGGTVNLTAGGNMVLEGVNSSYVINVNGSENPTSTGGNGAGGNVIMSAGNNITLNSTTSGVTQRSLIEANGAKDGNGAGGTVQVKNANNLTITSVGPRFMVQANGGSGSSAANSGNGGSILFGAGAGASALTGDITISRSILYAAAGKTENMANGNAGTIAFNFAGDYNGTQASVQSIASGNGGGGSISVTSTGGDINLNDIDTYFHNWTDGNGTVTVSANNITNNGTIASRAARVIHAAPAPNANDGGTVSITATGALTNNGDINASAWSPSLEAISTGDESTGQGGFINIVANSMTNNGSATEERAGRIYAHGGLNTVGATQGDGGRVHINVTGNFSDNGFGKIDSRGNPVNPSDFATGLNRVYISAGSMDINGRVNASGFYANDAGGYVELRTTGGNMNINNGAFVSASGGIADVFNNLGPGGQVVLDATGDINVQGDVHAVGTGGFDGGNIVATATGNINLLNSGQFNASSETTGDGGTININGTQLTINSTTAAQSSIVADGGATSGAGGTITLGSAGNRIVVDVDSTVGGGSNAIVSAEGGGRIDIWGSGVDFDTPSDRLMMSTNGNGGDGGVIAVDATGAFNFDGQMTAQADSVSGGDGGGVVITAAGNITMDGDISNQGYAVTAAGGQTSNGGAVIITSTGGSYTQNSTSVIDASSVRVNNYGDARGDLAGGDVTITATDITIISPASGASIISRGADGFNGWFYQGGDGGNIVLDANQASGTLTIGGDVNLVTDTRGGGVNGFLSRGGDAGDVTVYFNTAVAPGVDTSVTGSFFREGGNATGFWSTDGADGALNINP